MKPLNKFLVFSAIAAITAGAIYIYSALNIGKAYTFTVPNFNLADKISSLKNEVKEFSFVDKNETGEDASPDSVGSESFLKTSVQSVKNGAFAAVKKNINRAVDAIGNTLGVDQSLIQDSPISGLAEGEENQELNLNCPPGN